MRIAEYGARGAIPRILLLALLFFLPVGDAAAAKIGEMGDVSVREQAMRFFSFRDPSVRYAVCGSVLLGITCGLVGSFIVVRRMALMGDALSHAVLPGVALGFLWNTTKDPVAIFIGATAAGLLGTATVTWITRTTRLKEDTAIGMVLAVFFSVGVCLVTMIQKLPTGNKSGIDKFLFGQAAAMDARDLQLMGVVAAVTIVTVFLFHKEFLITSFDPAYARSLGLPAGWIHHVLMLLLAFAAVIALQAVGVVLVSAMLITPAAAAYLLTDRLKPMLLLSAALGVAAGVTGAFLSFLGNNLPTGPFMVIGASMVFLAAFLFGARHGVVVRWFRKRSQSSRIQRENTLKAVYHVLEAREFLGESVSAVELAERRRETVEEARREIRLLERHGMVTLHEEGEALTLTPEGWGRACSVVRNHRLWELYLTNEAHIAADHVHEDAEQIEHVLGEEVVMRLEKGLQYATKDPHGRNIPSLRDIHGLPAEPRRRLAGYGKDAP